ncbi:MAG: hypothetical protein ABH833_00295 [Parcubacteria group bacterium]
MFEPDIEIEYDDYNSRIILKKEGTRPAENVKVQFSSEGRILSEYTLEDKVWCDKSVIINVINPFDNEFQGSVQVTYKGQCRCQLFVKKPPIEGKGYFALDSYSRRCRSWIRRILCNGKPPIGRNR